MVLPLCVVTAILGRRMHEQTELIEALAVDFRSYIENQQQANIHTCLWMRLVMNEWIVRGGIPSQFGICKTIRWMTARLRATARLLDASKTAPVIQSV